MGADSTKYRLLTKEHVSVAEFAGQPILKVAPEALTLLAALELVRRGEAELRQDVPFGDILITGVR